ncbi:cupin domain-containing protein [Halothermothrix orenii]|uniref:Predicted enzyme of the cupin superfamily n=1 Tax=Halothermothrix orenii (strain H 168 / OCM 544 / DSM 9562) TaxID=373903 RepID=B8CX53_HALOH|nr:cupin domain-containing protein [Halothermothrix orenii]ACL69872.1 predicted enzyme of the cupin superfamily [Halothermothrix orenii H 168]
MARIKVERPSQEKLRKLGVESWPIWEKDVSEFDWYYDEKEVCYLLQGEVEVKTNEETVKFGAGDLVTFPEGLECSWKITKPVKKHYKLGQ